MAFDPLALLVLSGTISAQHTLRSLCHMLGAAVVYSLSPQPERARFHMRAHQLDNLLLADSKTCADSVKRRAILPRHLNNTGQFAFRKCGELFAHIRLYDVSGKQIRKRHAVYLHTQTAKQATCCLRGCT